MYMNSCMLPAWCLVAPSEEYRTHAHRTTTCKIFNCPPRVKSSLTCACCHSCSVWSGHDHWQSTHRAASSASERARGAWEWRNLRTQIPTKTKASTKIWCHLRNIMISAKLMPDDEIKERARESLRSNPIWKLYQRVWLFQQLLITVLFNETPSIPLCWNGFQDPPKFRTLKYSSVLHESGSILLTVDGKTLTNRSEYIFSRFSDVLIFLFKRLPASFIFPRTLYPTILFCYFGLVTSIWWTFQMMSLMI